MSASSTAATATGAVFVVTHVITAPAAASHSQPEDARFPRRWPQVLAILQIVSGLLVLLFGVLMFPCYGTERSIFVWEAVFLISGGSLVAAAWKHSKSSLVKVALGFSVVAAGVSAVATLIYLADIFLFPHERTPCWSPRHPVEQWVSSDGNFVALLLCSFLGFVFSTCLSAFGTKALRHGTNQPPLVLTNQAPQPASETAVTAPPSPPVSQAPPPSDNNYETMKSPQYDAAIVS